MKQIFAVLVFMMAEICSAEKLPAWFIDTAKSYPPSRYISAMGEGATLKKAEANAAAGVAVFFKADIKQVSTAIQNAKLIEENGGAEIQNEESIFSKMEIRSEAELFCMHFTQGYFAKKEKTWYVLSYIDREELVQVYEAKIEPLMEVARMFSESARREEEPLFALLDLQRARSTLAVAKEYIENVITAKSVLWEKYEPVLKELTVLDSQVSKSRKGISFAVVSESEQAEPLIAGVASVLQDNGFVYTKKEALYTAMIDVSFSEENYVAGIFVRPTLTISIVNKQEIAVASYAKVFPRYSRDTLEASYSLAFVRIQQELEENFLLAYRYF